MSATAIQRCNQMTRRQVKAGYMRFVPHPRYRGDELEILYRAAACCENGGTPVNVNRFLRGAGATVGDVLLYAGILDLPRLHAAL